MGLGGGEHPLGAVQMIAACVTSSRRAHALIPQERAVPVSGHGLVDKILADAHAMLRRRARRSACLLGHNREATVTDEAPNEREQALHYAATLRGLSLVRTGNKYALAEYKLTDATLDEIAAFLDVDGSPGAAPSPDGGDRRTNLRAMLKAEHALLAELGQEKRRAGERSRDQATTEAALAEIRRRIAEMQGDIEPKGSP